jgi:hypothetical protein
MEKIMEEIKFGRYIWQKYKGDEGQDVYIAKFLIDQNTLLGNYADHTSYDILIDNDADFYLPSNLATDDRLSENDVAFKFRKNAFSQEEQHGAYDGLFDAAGESNNRGMAAGPRTEKSGTRDWVTPYQIDILEYYIKGQPRTVDGSIPIDDIKKKHETAKHQTRGGVWLRNKVESSYGEYSKFFPTLMEELATMDLEEARAVAKNVSATYISDTSYAAPLWSGIAGFYGRYPRIPYGRATSYVEYNLEKFKKSYPYARKLEAEFKRLMPERWARQNEYAAKMDKKFLIGEDTTFTTITVNTTTADRNARMACHRDAGSLNSGFSNLTVVTKDGKGWEGGYLVVPEVRAAINVRPGDLLFIDNMRIIHGNTPIEPPESGKDDMLRMSLVYYFREDMAALGSWEYENLRRKFVDTRRKNKKHEFWRHLWNGVSPKMWESSEWYEFLEDEGGKEMVWKYHPKAYEIVPTLDSFF